MRKIDQEHYDVHHVGSFGRFFSGNSFPVDYLQTSFTAADLLNLSFAQDLHPDGQDFELLMQRDIDKGRVLREVVPYINPSDLSDKENKERAIFFPPLLVAVVPVKNRQMQPYYPDEKLEYDTQILYREWPGQLRIQFYLDDGISAYTQKLLEKGALKEFKVDRAPVKLSIRKPKGSEEGASLVVIDGQHRLAALRYVYDKNPQALEGVCIPVCILFPPNSTQAYKDYMGGTDVLTVHSVFRSLFVDVNTTMKDVGGHFNVLLSDSSLSGIVCRKFCDAILRSRGERGLAQIEWNIKSKKDSTVLNRSYSITSIGILHKALSKSLAGASKSALLSFLLVLPEVEPNFELGDNDSDESPVVEWERFSLHQKRYLEAQVAKHMVPCLEEIFFGMSAYKSLHEKFIKALDKLEKDRDDSANQEQHNAAILQILEYKPIEDDRHHRRARDIYQAFEADISRELDGQVESLVQYAIVQRGILDAWIILLDKLKDLAVAPIVITKAFVELLNFAFRDDGSLFKPSKAYMQYTVWELTNIKPLEETRTAISNCILTILATDGHAEKFTKALGEVADRRVVNRLITLGTAKAGDFIGQYHKFRQRNFIRTYTVDFAMLSDDDRNYLRELEQEYQKQIQEVRDNLRKQEDVSGEFLKQVEKYVGRDVKKAIADFRDSFNYVGGIAIEEIFEEVETE